MNGDSQCGNFFSEGRIREVSQPSNRYRVKRPFSMISNFQNQSSEYTYNINPSKKIKFNSNTFGNNQPCENKRITPILGDNSGKNYNMFEQDVNMTSYLNKSTSKDIKKYFIKF
jgi:hypothetical protein